MTTIRVRLTLIYSGLFLLTSVVLLVTVNLLLRRALEARIARLPGGAVAPGDRPPPLPQLPELVNDVIGYQWEVTAVTVGILALVSLVVGWLVAGRILRPIHRITATAQRLSLSTLHERIALTGPKDELKELADTFDAMLDRLERSIEGQRRFIANASHELRTPLAVQRAAIEIGLPEDVGEIRGTLLLHTVEVTLSRGVLTVRNTGPHVPQERFGDLFKPFRRLHTTRGQGAGLGLSIVASIAKAHGADVRANPNPDGGLELVVVFTGSEDAVPATDDSSQC
ncbi:signal transduction histidine kinase [Streptosporangium album]|uniref:histidine kinase n=1 Tax=Streptosporangium album TaxID=47479 RepID=A0A7W7S4I0_9ACTN|nr:ATP-binding protein [Streptosporangium album]MBB4943532.1 signal transduction histidine kinase [Streptosporangium album]